MSNKRFNAILGAALLSVGLCHEAKSQDFLSSPVDATLPSPQPPYLQKPEAIAYTATFNHKQPWPRAKADTPEEKEKLEDMKKADPRIKAVSVEKVGDVRHDIKQWNEDGALQTEAWYSQTAAFKKALDAEGHLRGIYSELAFIDKPDAFPELNWVGKNTFVGAIPLGPKKTIDVYQFVVEGPVAGFDPILYNNETVTAYVDDATRLPLALKTSRYTLLYTYRDTPSSLNPPPEYQKAFQEYRAAKSRVYRVP